MKKSIKIYVVCGGISSEREISLKSGSAVYAALCNNGYTNVTLFDLTSENLGELICAKPDIAFLALHGKGGEDGCIQGALELAGIPYTGSGVCTSAVCMNKVVTKRVLESVGLPTAKFLVFHKDECDDRNMIMSRLVQDIGFPMVLKSPSQGSSIGVFIVKDKPALDVAINDVFKYGNLLLAEQFINGIELTLPILGGKCLTILPVIEITSEREFYDYSAKYTSGLCHHIIPAHIDEKTEKRVIEIGAKAYAVLGCRGLARIDFIIDQMNTPIIIETNTLPGMTEMSLFPDAARYVGISFENLVEKILLEGLSTKRKIG